MARFLLCSLLFWVTLGLLAQPGTAQVPGAPTPVGSGTTLEPGRLIFRLKPAYAAQARANGVAVTALQTALAGVGATSVQQKFPQAQEVASKRPGAVDLSLLYQVEFDRRLAPEKACQQLLLSGAVEYAEPRYSRQPLYLPNDPLADSTTASGQYYLKNIRAYRAWDVTQGDTSMVIGIIDGGTRYTHEDLASQIQYNRLDPIDGIDNDHDGYIDNYRGWDFADNDNDATREANSVHGILVAGCAAGAVNNGKGIAGVGFKCRFMPLKIYPSTPAGSFGGFEAIVYAADHGCQVINLSWGGEGGRSQFEQDIINYAAINHDVVIVAAAGNTNDDLDFYPASYNNVISVASLLPSDEKGTNATYSRRVDLSAPGLQILTTFGNNDSDYIAVGGSSFAAPLVAGAAALVRVRFPQFNAAQVAAQLRQTADNIYQLPGNTAYAGKLGAGRLNVLRAVALTDRHSARIMSSTITPARAAFLPGDALQLTAEVQNLLLPVTNLRITVTSLSPYLAVQQGTFTAGALATLQRATNSATPFRLDVAGTVPLNTSAVLRYHLEDAATGYQEDQYTTVLLNPDYVVLDANNLRLTLTSRGKLGYVTLNNSIGEGVRYKGGAPLLYEGGLLVATSPTRVSNNLRNNWPKADQSFYSLARATLRDQTVRADQEAYAVFRDSLPGDTRSRTVGVQVRQVAYAWAADPHRDYVILEYHLTNLTPDTLRPLHAGLFMDWDLAPDATRNTAGWDSTRALAYVYAPASPNLFVGVKHLVGGKPSVYSITDAPTAPVYLGNGFTTAEKFLSLSSGTRNATAGFPLGADVAQVTGAAIPRLAPHDSVVVAFAVLAAPSLAQLQTTAEAAQSRYSLLLPVRAPLAKAGIQLYPNPSNGRVQLVLPSSLGSARVQVISALGQVVLSQSVTSGASTLLNLTQQAAGIYVVQVATAAGVFSQRLAVQQ
ncbi:S8 family serine peptidase [Hymenobacter taeanensis]|uniref:S8 family serine peptidase n=1 Tax=Hymenobacter taeanensis TaxID=2735321 RepID=A0A6M6BJ42_9BACT|nr:MULTISPECIES: S8 family peptidase [Hymenobacter]QJX47908.1 S8 family serine peptidase [Hymenobacter taeanensis]UOQ82648.1 S8 family peptidase [Hymenobacter sp. 5414T-23]